jgi:hypothetical protein
MFDAAGGGIDRASFSEGPAASFQRLPREAAIDYLGTYGTAKGAQYLSSLSGCFIRNGHGLGILITIALAVGASDARLCVQSVASCNEPSA